MARHDTHLAINADDLQAARVLNLAVKFFGATRPLTSSTIHHDLYPQLEEKSFLRAFMRDRDLLASFGIVIKESSTYANEQCWQIDEHQTYVQGQDIDASDARILYILCHDMVSDQSFAYRDELRMALAKISQMYGRQTGAQGDTTPNASRKLLAVLVGCLSQQHAASVVYTDAQGKTVERTLALLGTFGLRQHTYFVATQVNRKGEMVDGSIRTYRLDRFQSARELPRVRYQIPLDFCVGDYERLPFQMGDAQGEAIFALPETLDREAERAIDTHGELADERGVTCWHVPYHDLEMLAAWSIGVDLLPLFPQELVDIRREILLRSSRADAYDPTLAQDVVPATADKTKTTLGRAGGSTLARQLVALATSLTKEGKVITARHIADALGVDHDSARHLIALVAMGSAEATDYLPVVLDDADEEVALMEGAHMAARQVRLTRSETIALLAALGELGIDADDPLYHTLQSSYAAPALSHEELVRSLETPSSSEDGRALRLC